MSERIIFADGQEATGELRPAENNETILRLDSGHELVLPTGSLERTSGGDYRALFSLDDVAGLEGHNEQSDRQVIPVIVEEADVQKRTIETGKVRVTKTVVEHEQMIDEPLFHTESEVTRTSVGRIVNEPPEIRYEDDGSTMIVPVVEEVMVVVKRFRIKEEIRIVQRKVETREKQTVKLLSDEVVVERVSSL